MMETRLQMVFTFGLLVSACFVGLLLGWIFILQWFFDKNETFLYSSILALVCLVIIIYVSYDEG